LKHLEARVRPGHELDWERTVSRHAHHVTGGL
jgi:hypothetical protein